MNPAAMTAEVAAPSPAAVRKLRIGQRITLRRIMIVVWRRRSAVISRSTSAAAEHRRGRGLHRDGGGEARGHQRGARAAPSMVVRSAARPDIA
jgi:hypothetical protein